MLLFTLNDIKRKYLCFYLQNTYICPMNKRITSLYVIVSNNKVIAFGNLKDTITTFQISVNEARNYQFYYRKFQKLDSFTINNYHFQRLI